MKPTTFAICGCGARGLTSYAPYAKKFPQNMQIVAGADLLPQRLAALQSEYGVAPNMCFSTAEEMLLQPRLADVMIIATQDRDHVKHALPALEKGYHILLEKPISPSLEECKALQAAAEKAQRTVVVCHVLRYTQFYSTLHKLINDGTIGTLQAIDATENIAYWHFAHSYVRGNWRSAAQSSPMILAKSCHDMDILRWLAGSKCRRISSVGSLSYFNKSNAPKGSTAYCAGGCAVCSECPYEAHKIYVTDQQHGVNKGNLGWPNSVVIENPTAQALDEALKTSPYGRCVFQCDNDVVDHQSVLMEFDHQITATFTVSAFTQNCHRTILLMGTKGELAGDMDDNTITFRPFGKPQEKISLEVAEEGHAGHGGGDFGMMHALCRLISNGEMLPSITSVDVSIESHTMAMAAEHSRLNGGCMVELDSFNK